MTVGGVIQRRSSRTAARATGYAAFTLEDKTGTVEVICWPETYREAEIDFTTDEPVDRPGTLEVGEERCQIIARRGHAAHAHFPRNGHRAGGSPGIDRRARDRRALLGN